MLRSASNLHGRTIEARDGEIGSVDDVYFDDEAWGIRYLVVKPGNWLSRRRVLISPHSVTRPGDISVAIHVTLTRDQVKHSPDIDTHQPVSRQHEMEYLDYYDYPLYWGGGSIWGMGAYPQTDLLRVATIAPEERERIARANRVQSGDVHLRSIDHVNGYHVQAVDDSVGHVRDVIFDDEAWAIRYLVVDTRNWWPGGKKVLIATQWIDQIDWPNARVCTSLTHDAIRSSPAYEDALPPSREYEARLHEFYGKEGYWR